MLDDRFEPKAYQSMKKLIGFLIRIWTLDLQIYRQLLMDFMMLDQGFPTFFDPRTPCLDTEDLATPKHLSWHDHDDYFEIWLIISGIL